MDIQTDEQRNERTDRHMDRHVNEDRDTWKDTHMYRQTDVQQIEERIDVQTERCTDR